MKDNIFSKNFLSYINSLTINAPKMISKKQIIGEHQVRNIGDNDDFYDYRSYNSGDDLRHIDWNIFRRHKKLFVKRFHKQQHLKVKVIIDNSQSLYFEEERIKCALKMAASLCLAAKNSKFDIQVITLTGNFKFTVSHSNRFSLNKIISELPKILNLKSSKIKNIKLNLRPDADIIFFISDFYRFRNLANTLKTFNNSKVPIIPVRIYRKHDQEPNINGNLELTDCNYQDTTQVAIDNKLITLYKQAYKKFEENIATYCKNRYIPIFAINADNVLCPQLSFNFVNGCLDLQQIK